MIAAFYVVDTDFRAGLTGNGLAHMVNGFIRQIDADPAPFLMGGIKMSVQHVPAAGKPVADALITAEPVARYPFHEIRFPVPDFRQRGFQMGLSQMSERTENHGTVYGDRHQIFHCPQKTESSDIEKLIPMFPHLTFDIHAVFENTAVVEGHPAGAVVTQPRRNRQFAREDRIPVSEEKFRRQRTQQKRIVIEQNKMFRQLADPEQIQFDGIGIEGRQVVRRDKITVIDQLQPGVRLIQPFRFLTAGLSFSIGIISSTIIFLLRLLARHLMP